VRSGRTIDPRKQSSTLLQWHNRRRRPCWCRHGGEQAVTVLIDQAEAGEVARNSRSIIKHCRRVDSRRFRGFPQHSHVRCNRCPLAINLQTAQALGIEVPSGLLSISEERASCVILGLKPPDRQKPKISSKRAGAISRGNITSSSPASRLTEIGAALTASACFRGIAATSGSAQIT